MDLLDRLRPRWRHPDPDVRAAAVGEMGRDDHERLVTVAADDPDPRVRRVAIRKLADAAVLERLATSDADPALRALAAERAREAWVGIACSDAAAAACEAALAHVDEERQLAAVAAAATHESVRRAALARVSGDRLLRDIVRDAADPAIRREALDRIRDPGVLRALAVAEGPPEVALRALERIDDPAVLRAIAENRSAAKSVRQRARARLPEDGPHIGLKEGRARQLELCTTVQALRHEADVTRAAERVRELEVDWTRLAKEVEPREDVAQQFAAACRSILDDAASLARRWAEAGEATAAIEESLATRAALCERIDGLDGADALRELDAARAAWHRLLPVADERGRDLSRRFALAVDRCRERHRAWRTDQGSRAALEAVVAEAEALAETDLPPVAKAWAAVEARWASALARAGEAGSLADRWAAAVKRLGERRDEVARARTDAQEANRQRLEQLCSRLAELATVAALKPSTARRELAAAEAALQDLGPLPPSERRTAWTARLVAARDELGRRIRREEETEEWRRWANVGAQEAIIARIEGLLESNDLAEGTRQLVGLQDEWASVATASPDKSQALWDRFRTARNELRRRCDAYLAENLEKKRALCAQVRDVGESTAWNETSELLRRLQAEWKAIGPVPGKHTRALWAEFREPCDRFFARRAEHFERMDAERGQAVAKKTALCEQAEALADSTDWEATATAVKKLQAEWKASGPLPRAQSEALWQRFRAACDRFFERRSRRDEIAREAELAQAETICRTLETIADAPEPGPSELDDAWAAWLRLDVAGTEAARPLRERAEAACARLAATHPAALTGTRLDPAMTRKRREKLCAKLEGLVGTGDEAPRALSIQEMALALRDRLATNTIAGKDAGRRQDVAREVERVYATWVHLGPALDDESRALAERFARARARAPK